MAPGITREQLHRQPEEFLNKSSTTTTDIDNLSATLASDMERVSPREVLPIEDVEQQIQIIQDAAGESMDSCQLRAFDVAVIMFTPIHWLRAFAEMTWRRKRTTKGARDLAEMEQFVRIFLQKSSGDEFHNDSKGTKRKAASLQGSNQLQSGAISPPASASASPRKVPAAVSSASSKVGRSNTAKDRAARRDDWKCVLTGAALPERAHIFPWAANKDDESLKRLKEVSEAAHDLWDPEFKREHKIDKDLLSGGLGCSDEYWNIICLNPLLHTFWAKCFWCFQLLDITPGSTEHDDAVIGLVFRSTKQRRHQAKLTTSQSETEARDIEAYWARNISFADDGLRKFVSKWRETSEYSGRDLLGSDGIVAAADADAAALRGLESGHIVRFTMPYTDCVKMKAVIELQFVCIQIASMSEAVDWPEFYVWPGESSWVEDSLERVERWFEEIDEPSEYEEGQ